MLYKKRTMIIFYLLLSFVLFLYCSEAEEKNVFVVNTEMSKNDITSILGEPDWIQVDVDGNCWGYFTSGFECVFENDILYAIRYMKESPVFPERIVNAGIVLGGEKQVYDKLGKIVDSDIGTYLTDYYSDNQTYMVALNYGKLSKQLENILVREYELPVFVGGKTIQCEPKRHKQWYTVGTYILDYLEYRIMQDTISLQHLYSSLQSRLPNINFQDAGIDDFFVIDKYKGTEEEIAAKLRNLILCLASEEGRRVKSRVPIVAVFDGFFIAGVLGGIGKDEKMSSICAVDEVINHFDGINRKFYSEYENSVIYNIDLLVGYLKAKDYWKRDLKKCAEEIHEAIKYKE